MPRYYLHIQQGDQLLRDPDGIECLDLEAARAEAVAGIRDILAEAIKRGADDGLEDVLVITDESGRELITIPFSEALPPRMHPTTRGS
jgi:hypothetical protein